MQILWGKWQFNSGHFWASPKFSHNFNREGWRSMNREGHSLVVTALGVPWISLLNILSVIGHYFWQSCSIFLVACSISYLLVLFFFLLFSSSLLVTMGHPHHFLAPLEAFLHFLKSCWAWVSGKEGPTSRSVGDNRSNKDWVLHGTPYTACCS